MWGMPGAERSDLGAGIPQLRADALRNRARVLQGARQAFAECGFEASYHEIARRAGVGVGTVYRRYPERQALVEAVLLDILDTLTDAALAACAEDDVWTGFSRFFGELSAYIERHAGLSARLEGGRGRLVGEAGLRLHASIETLRIRALRDGLRPDVGTRDLLFLAQAAAFEGCGLGGKPDEAARARALGVILDGLRRG